MGRAAELQPLVVRQVELGPHLDVELVDERSFLGNLDRVRVEFRGAERRDLLLVGQLLQAGHQHLGLDLLGDRLVVLLLDQLTWGFAGAEPADLRLVALDQFRVLLVEPLVDLLRDVDLAELCITSAGTVRPGPAPDGAFILPDVAEIGVRVSLAPGDRCERCWRVLPEVGQTPGSPDLCHRCAAVVNRSTAQTSAG